MLIFVAHVHGCCICCGVCSRADGRAAVSVMLPVCAASAAAPRAATAKCWVQAREQVLGHEMEMSALCPSTAAATPAVVCKCRISCETGCTMNLNVMLTTSLYLYYDMCVCLCAQVPHAVTAGVWRLAAAAHQWRVQPQLHDHVRQLPVSAAVGSWWLAVRSWVCEWPGGW